MSWATADLPFDITGTHTVLLFLDIVDTNSVDDVKCPLLRSFPFKHYNDEIFKRSRVLIYRSFEHLRFHKVMKSNFHSLQVELRNAEGHLVHFFPVGQVQLTLLFQKKILIISSIIIIKNGQLKCKRIPCLILGSIFLRKFQF